MATHTAPEEMFMLPRTATFGLAENLTTREEYLMSLELRDPGFSFALQSIYNLHSRDKALKALKRLPFRSVHVKVYCDYYFLNNCITQFGIFNKVKPVQAGSH